MIRNGYIKIHRKIIDWEWWDNPLMIKAWIYFIISANIRDIKWKGVTIPRGTFVTSTHKLSLELQCTRRTIRYILDRLVLSDNIEYKCTKKYTIISICNYDSYQLNEEGILSGSVPKDIPMNTPKDIPMNTPTSAPIDMPKCTPTSAPQSIHQSIPERRNKEEYIYPPPPHAYACARDGEIQVNDLAEWLRYNSGDDWKEMAMMQLGISTNEDLEWAFDEFERECLAQGVLSKRENDIKSHFINMMRIIKQKKIQNGTGNTKSGYPQHTDPRELAKIARGMAQYEADLENRK